MRSPVKEKVMGYEYEVYGWADGEYVLVGECETLDHALKTMTQAADDLGFKCIKLEWRPK